MVVPFGISVGDFIAGIKLIHDLADALKESCSSLSEFRDLVRELYSLERALISVKNVIDPKNPESLPYDVADVDALKQVVLQVRRTVDEFLGKNRKFMLPLGVVGRSSSGVKDWARRIEWGRYKRDDVQALRWKINGHSAAVNMILLSMQLEASGKSNTLISDMSNSLVKMKMQVSELQKLMMEVLANNLQVYQEVRAVRTQMPAQVLLQEPVLFWDARGHFAPFHLDFVNSAEAFIAVLKVRFKEVGLNKIEKGEFAISEVATKNDIDLLQSWSRCFRPGQKVNMSMIFDLSPRNKDNSCPVCGFTNSGNSSTEIQCIQCNRYYQKIIELSSYQRSLLTKAVTNKMRADESVGMIGDQQMNRNQNSRSSTTNLFGTTDVEEEDKDETVSEYARVRLYSTEQRRQRDHYLDIFADLTCAKDIVKAVLHTIFFHRCFSSEPPHTYDLFDLTLPAIDSVELEALISNRALKLMRVMESTHQQRGGGQLVVHFFGIADEEICWERWTLNVVFATPQLETDVLEVRHAMEKSLRKAASRIVNITNADTDHIPPITTDAYPFQILVNPKASADM